MEIAESTIDKTTIVALIGNLDSMTSGQAQGRINGLIDGGVRSMVLDLGPLDYASSAGLRVFLTTAKKIQSHGGKFALSGAQEQIRELFRISGFGTLFSIFASVDDAVADIG